jgi:hypothetical protein
MSTDGKACPRAKTVLKRCVVVARKKINHLDFFGREAYLKATAKTEAECRALHCGGKSAAFGRDDSYWWRALESNKENVGNRR